MEGVSAVKSKSLHCRELAEQEVEAPVCSRCWGQGRECLGTLG